MAEVDPSRCPTCAAPNRCAVAAAAGDPAAVANCWCARVSIAPEALARVPEPARGVACLCEACGVRPTADRPGGQRNREPDDGRMPG